MMNKIVTTVGQYAVKKIGNKTLTKTMERFDEPFATFNREILGVKSLNVGEDEELACYRQYPYDIERCRDIGNRLRGEYHRTGRYNPYRKK